MVDLVAETPTLAGFNRQRVQSGLGGRLPDSEERIRHSISIRLGGSRAVVDSDSYRRVISGIRQGHVL